MKILIVNPFGIGDILFTTPLAASLTEGGHDVYYWSNERVSELLRHNPNVKGVFSLARGDIKKIFNRSTGEGVARSFGMFKRLKKERFDAALDFSLDYRYGLILLLLGIKKRVGFNYKERGRFLTDAVKIEGFKKRHMVEHYNDLLPFIDSTIKPVHKLELSAGTDYLKEAELFLREHGVVAKDILVGIAPGGGESWGKDAFRKRWPKEKFAYVAEKLSSENGYKIVVFGASDESDICGYISEKTGKASIDTCGKLTLGQYAAILERCKLLITNDGGPLHMAVALGVPTVSIFGPVDEKVYGPYSDSSKHIVISGTAECRPCYRNFRYPLCKTFICLDSIEPERVLDAAKKILGSE